MHELNKLVYQDGEEKTLTGEYQTKDVHLKYTFVFKNDLKEIVGG